MKCPKCNRKMEMLFNQWRCYHCKPSKDQKKPDTDIKDVRITKNEKWMWDNWPGGYD